MELGLGRAEIRLQGTYRTQQWRVNGGSLQGDKEGENKRDPFWFRNGPESWLWTGCCQGDPAKVSRHHPRPVHWKQLILFDSIHLTVSLIRGLASTTTGHLVTWDFLLLEKEVAHSKCRISESLDLHPNAVASWLCAAPPPGPLTAGFKGLGSRLSPVIRRISLSLA